MADPARLSRCCITSARFPSILATQGTTPPDHFIAKSARLEAVIDIMHRIKEANERVLVFIEHREMQFRFAEIVRHMFGLDQIDVINGDTPIPRRQEIVNRFQRHLRSTAVSTC